ncbi:MAG TPA: sulfite exporter TauE/SafE family protein [Blastocatellia bacterium]|nr:sulfite exporter TauE/SafE family protein [Blastocatellia bacterium]
MTTAKVHGAHQKLLPFGIALILSGASLAGAHPLGNFTINHYARIEVADERVALRCVVDMAEIPTYQEMQIIDTDSDGFVSEHELKDYSERTARNYASGLVIRVDNEPIELHVVGSRATTPPGAGNLPTLRIELDISGSITRQGLTVRRLSFENTNYRDRLGWREIVIAPSAGICVFDTEAYGSGLTDELRAYPEDSLSAPLNERACHLSFARGIVPAGAAGLLTREGRPAAGSRDRLAELISVPEVTPLVVLLGLLGAAMLGAIHALSPGHGKTVVGAYLVGSRGTARHAAFLGLTVTVTHTLGVFALGLATLFASQYVVPEKLFPVLSLISGGIVLAMGATLFAGRLRAALQHGRVRASHHHIHEHLNDAGHVHHTHGGHADHDHSHGSHSYDDPHTHHDHHSHESHSHGGKAHTHLPPGADGSQVTWRSLLALGISGGLLPCPSALIVLLSAISLHRVGYGLVLVVAFSLGLAATLTAVGLAFVYAARLVKRPARSSGLVRVLPVVSAFVIMCVGAAILYQALPK